MNSRKALMKTFASWGVCLMLLGGAGALPGRAQVPQEVVDAMELLGDYQRGLSAYHLRNVTEGKFVKSTAHIYYYPSGNTNKWKVENIIELPEPSTFILEEGPGDQVAYFPLSGLHVQTRLQSGYTDILAASLVSTNETDVLLDWVKTGVLTPGDPVSEIRLLFDARKLMISPLNQDITIFVRYETATGQIREIEQRRLGLSQISTLTYLSFDPVTVQQAVPATPDPTQAANEPTFEEAIQTDNLLRRKMQQAAKEQDEKAF